MITTFEEILKNEGFEHFKKYDIDKWTGGPRYQYHITGLMLMDGGGLCLWYEDFYDRKWSKDELQKFDGVCKVFTIGEGSRIWADSEGEMNVDYKYLVDKHNADNNHKANNAMTLLKQFAKAYNELHYELQLNINKAIKDEKNDDFAIIRSRLYRWSDHSEDVDDDAQREIARIYRNHAVKFRNTENQEIWTQVDLTQAVAVYQCQYEHRSCMCIETSDGKEYHVFKDENKLEYIALCVLYDECI